MTTSSPKKKAKTEPKQKAKSAKPQGRVKIYAGRKKPETLEAEQPATTARVNFKITCNNLDILRDVLARMNLGSATVTQDKPFWVVQFSKMHTVTPLSK